MNRNRKPEIKQVVTIAALLICSLANQGSTSAKSKSAKVKPSKHTAAAATTVPAGSTAVAGSSATADANEGTKQNLATGKKTNHPTDADTYAINGGKVPGTPDKDAPKKEWSGSR